MASPRVNRASEFAYDFVGEHWVCAYCGDTADTIDHTVPAWFVSGNIALIARTRLFKVASCAECNFLAGAKVDASFIERKRRIARKLRKKHLKILYVAHWYPDELEELGYQLRRYVESGTSGRARLIQRLHQLDNFVIPEGMTDLFFNNIPQVAEEEFTEDG